MSQIKPKSEDNRRLVVNLVRPEKDLLEMGYFGAHTRHGPNSNVKRKVTLSTKDNKVQRFVTFDAPEDLGLPNIADQDKFYAFMKILFEERSAKGLKNIPTEIDLPAARLLSELRLTDGKDNYEALAEWGRRMASTTIHSQKAIYNPETQTYTDETTHVFRSFYATTTMQAGRSPVVTYKIRLEDWVVRGLTHAYIVPEDLDKYRQLSRPVAKGIFNQLHLLFYASDGRPVEKDYENLCSILNVRSFKYVAKIKEKMGPALEELVSIGYLKSWKVARMSTKANAYKIVMEAGTALLNSFAVSRAKALPDGETKPSAENGLLERLIYLKVAKKTCEELLKGKDLAELEDQIDYLEIYVKQRQNLRNPAGYVVDFIRENRPIPKHFESPRKKAEKHQRYIEQLREQEADGELFHRYELWRVDTIEKRLTEKYGPVKLDEMVTKLIPRVIKSTPSARYLKRQEQYVMAFSELRKEEGSKMSLPNFEEWLTSHIEELEREVEGEQALLFD